MINFYSERIKSFSISFFLRLHRPPSQHCQLFQETASASPTSPSSEKLLLCSSSLWSLIWFTTNFVEHRRRRRFACNTTARRKVNRIKRVAGCWVLFWRKSRSTTLKANGWLNGFRSKTINSYKVMDLRKLQSISENNSSLSVFIHNREELFAWRECFHNKNEIQVNTSRKRA